MRLAIWKASKPESRMMATAPEPCAPVALLLSTFEQGDQHTCFLAASSQVVGTYP